VKCGRLAKQDQTPCFALECVALRASSWPSSLGAHGIRLSAFSLQRWLDWTIQITTCKLSRKGFARSRQGRFHWPGEVMRSWVKWSGMVTGDGSVLLPRVEHGQSYRCSSETTGMMLTTMWQSVHDDAIWYMPGDAQCRQWGLSDEAYSLIGRGALHLGRKLWNMPCTKQFNGTARQTTIVANQVATIWWVLTLVSLYPGENFGHCLSVPFRCFGFTNHCKRVISPRSFQEGEGGLVSAGDQADNNPTGAYLAAWTLYHHQWKTN